MLGTGCVLLEVLWNANGVPGFFTGPGTARAPSTSHWDRYSVQVVGLVSRTRGSQRQSDIS